MYFVAVGSLIGGKFAHRIVFQYTNLFDYVLCVSVQVCFVLRRCDLMPVASLFTLFSDHITDYFNLQQVTFSMFHEGCSSEVAHLNFESVSCFKSDTQIYGIFHRIIKTVRVRLSDQDSEIYVILFSQNFQTISQWSELNWQLSSVVMQLSGKNSFGSVVINMSVQQFMD